jgi:hypothetical protein
MYQPCRNIDLYIHLSFNSYDSHDTHENKAYFIIYMSEEPVVKTKDF